MKSNYLDLAAATVTVLAIAGFFFLRPAPAVFKDGVTLYIYTVDEKPTGAAAIAVPAYSGSSR